MVVSLNSRLESNTEEAERGRVRIEAETEPEAVDRVLRLLHCPAAREAPSDLP